MTAPSASRKVVLAREPAFVLGALHVDPPRRETVGPAGRDVLEPRVMQVLIALARAEDGIVTRDELILACWDGRVVGDDAINRTIGRLRQLASRHDGAAFALETIRKVGYRLTAAEIRPGAETDELPMAAAHLPIAAAYLAFPAVQSLAVPPPVPAAAPRSWGRGLRSAALAAGLAVIGGGAAHAPQWIAEYDPAPQAIFVSQSGEAVPLAGAGPLRVRIRGEVRHHGRLQSFPEGTLTLAPGPSESVGRAPEPLLDWLTPSSAPAGAPRDPELNQI